jgi:hypothetical protein
MSRIKRTSVGFVARPRVCTIFRARRLVSSRVQVVQGSTDDRRGRSVVSGGLIRRDHFIGQEVFLGYRRTAPTDHHSRLIRRIVRKIETIRFLLATQHLLVLLYIIGIIYAPLGEGSR